MNSGTIGIIDYGMGNLKSVLKAFRFIGCDAKIITEPDELDGCAKLVLPGVGAFCDAIAALRDKGLDCAIKDAVARGVPFLGICLGMQLLFDESHENGVYEGLGILPGRITRLPETVKVPHIGWNSLDIKKPDPLFTGFGGGEVYVYFVHSYCLETDADIVCAETDYGRRFPSAIQKDNVFAAQFHPEKSGDAGLNILKNFGRLK